MRTQHKYFRNQEYKKKVERKYANIRWNANKCIVYTTEEEATNNLNSYVFYNEQMSRYEYFDKPNIPYKIIIKNYNKKSNSYKKYYRTYCNRKFRKNNQKYLISNNKAMYRKMNEYWWNID